MSPSRSQTISWSCKAHCVAAYCSELKWTGKAFYMTSFKRGYMGYSVHAAQHYQWIALTTIVKRTFLGCVHAHIAKAESAFWNADSNADFITPFTGVLGYAFLEKKTISWASFAYWSRQLFELKLNRKGSLYDVILNVIYMWFCVHASTRIKRFALTTIVNALFLRSFESAFWNDVYSKISMEATAFCSNHVWKRWFWPQKLSMNAPPFWNRRFETAGYSKSAF